MKEKRLNKIDNLENFLADPLKYSTFSVRDFLANLEDVEDIKAILEVDKRKSVVTLCNFRLNKENNTLHPLRALSMHYSGSINDAKLKRSLKGDSKYLDYIVSEYKKSRERNAKLKRKQKAEIMPVIRLHNMSWSKKINITPEIMVSGDVSNIIKLGLVN